MFTQPNIGSQLTPGQQRDMLAPAGQQRLVRQLHEHTTATRRAARTGRRITRLLKRPPSGAPLMNHTAAASSHPNWQDPS